MSTGYLSPKALELCKVGIHYLMAALHKEGLLKIIGSHDWESALKRSMGNGIY